MLIRPAAREDVAGIASLVKHYWEFESITGFDGPRIETLLRDLLSKPERGACWVAEADGRLCGYLLAVFMNLRGSGSLEVRPIKDYIRFLVNIRRLHAVFDPN